jgi:transcription elongation factor Elf1
MNRNELYRVNWTETVKNNKEYIKNVLYDILNKRYRNKHTQYHNIFKNIVEGDAERTPAQCLDICIKKTEKSKFPLKYMLRVWSGISTQIEDCDSRKGKKKILSKYMDLDIFSKFLDKMLNRSIKNFLDIKEEENESESDSD